MTNMARRRRNWIFLIVSILGGGASAGGVVVVIFVVVVIAVVAVVCFDNRFTFRLLTILFHRPPNDVHQQSNGSGGLSASRCISKRHVKRKTHRPQNLIA